MKRKAQADCPEGIDNGLVGQPEFAQKVMPYVRMYRSGLNPEGQPIGTFLLLGPTGTGKTHAVETLANHLHGSRKNVLRIDCGEFQMEHEVAKLIGAPPGYLGHKETTPILTQARLAGIASEKCSASMVLFDEIEKAAPSLMRILLGVMDKGALTLGDNNRVNFERSMIFFTSNLGAAELERMASGGYGLGRAMGGNGTATAAKMAAVGLSASERFFSAEFRNRLSEVIQFRPLSADALATICELEIGAVIAMIRRRVSPNAPEIDIDARSKRWLVENGTSAVYGARELKRTITRNIVHPIAELMARETPQRITVRCKCDRLVVQA